MRGFLASGVLLLKSNKKYVLTFKILAQILIDYSFLHEKAIASISYAIQLININIHKVPSLGISWPVG
jgi:hypothetical protein